MKRRRPSYKNLDKIPTKKIKEILSDPYCRGITGNDYEPVKHELESILLTRELSLHDSMIREFEVNYGQN